MNREDIIRMAHEASPDLTWFAATEDPSQASAEELQFLERFAALVAAAEREACAAICDRFQARGVGMQPAECAGAIRARGQA